MARKRARESIVRELGRIAKSQREATKRMHQAIRNRDVQGTKKILRKRAQLRNLGATRVNELRAANREHRRLRGGLF